MINGHGDDTFNFSHISANFSTNVYHSPAIPALEDYLKAQIHLITQYPEPDANSLKALISEQYQISKDQLWITNGAIEGIYLIAKTFQNKTATIMAPTFSEYEDASRIHNINLNFISNIEEYNGQTDLFWLCNPNNPTGCYLDDETLIVLFKQFPNTVFVVDESYFSFVKNKRSATFAFKDLPNVITLHSLTKCFAIPGLRLGYFSSARELMQKISYFAMPWSVNQLAIQAGKFLISHRDKFDVPLEQLLIETQALRDRLDTIPSLRTLPTSTHFFLVEIQDQKITAQRLKEILGAEYGILIRDCANFEGLTPYYFRLATQQSTDNETLVHALSIIFN